MSLKLTEDWIIAQAPGASAVQNGRKLSQKGSFSAFGRTEDNTLFWADCAGSGKNPYHTSIDFTNESTPTCRCSCPSRQFPCKHAIGLMFEMLADKDFPVMEVPEDLANKRAKQAARTAKKEQAAGQSDTPAKPKKTSNAAKMKKIKKQLEGIEKAEQMLSDLLSHGLGTLSGTSVKTYEALAKDLGSCYLTGAQTAFLRLAGEVKKIRTDKEQASYEEALRILIRLNAMLQKARIFLQQKLDENSFELEDTLLYEALGGVWKLEELEKIGCVKQEAQLVQLSFDVCFDSTRKEYIDRGYWIALEDGAIYQTLNYRPLKALKYVKAEDTCFTMCSIPKLCCYPGTGCQRVRWEQCEMGEVDQTAIETIRAFAERDLAQVVKRVKNEIKNTMSEKYMPVLLNIQHMGKIGETYVAQTEDGARIVLKDRVADGADHWTTDRLEWLGCSTEDLVVFGLLYYEAGSLWLHPYSVVTESQIVRLQY